MLFTKKQGLNPHILLKTSIRNLSKFKNFDKFLLKNKTYLISKVHLSNELNNIIMKIKSKRNKLSFEKFTISKLNGMSKIIGGVGGDDTNGETGNPTKGINTSDSGRYCFPD